MEFESHEAPLWVLVVTPILALTLSIAMIYIAVDKWQGMEERLETIETLTEELNTVRIRLDHLKQWMSELGLPIEEREVPVVEEEPQEESPSSTGPGQPAFETAGTVPAQTIDLYFPSGLEPEIDIYLGWQERYPEGYVNLIRWGRGETPPLSLPPTMIEACEIAAAGQNIDDYLANYPRSPLNGYGQEFAYASWKHKTNPYLLVALTAAESTFATDGFLPREHHNAWGMKGPNKTGLYAVNGWMWWSDWPSAIDGSAYFVSVYWPGAETAYDLRGYCEGNPPMWIYNVEIVRSAMTKTAWAN